VPNDDIKDGRMFLMLGKCQDRFKDIPDASVDLFVVGLPYQSTDEGWDVLIPPAEFWAEVKRTRKPGAPICFLCNAKLQAMLIESNKEEFVDLIVWPKPEAVDPANKLHFRKACEYVVIFCDQKYKHWNPVESTGSRYTEHDDPEQPVGASIGGEGMHSKHRECPPAHVAADGSVHRLPVLKVACERCGAVPGARCTNDKGKEAANAHAERIRTYLAGEIRCDVCGTGVADADIVGVRYPTNVRYFPQDKAALAESKHETPNPVSISAYLIDCLSKPGDTVCDFTMGGGSTGVAAVNMGRYFIGIEMLYGYFYYAAHRIQNTALGSNKEYEKARKLTNNCSQPRELLEDVEDWKKRTKKHEKELRGWREIADTAMLAVLKANPGGLTSSEARKLSGLGMFAGRTLERLEKSGAVVRNQAEKGGRVLWTAAGQGLAAAASGD
jgi:DNA modification methylase